MSIDVGEALNGIARAVERRGALEAFGERSFRELFVLRNLPIEVRLGGAVVLDRAQRVQDAGRTWGRAHNAAVRAAARYLKLVQARALGVRSRSADLPAC